LAYTAGVLDPFAQAAMRQLRSGPGGVLSQGHCLLDECKIVEQFLGLCAGRDRP